MKKILKSVFAGVIVWCIGLCTVSNCYAKETIVKYDVRNSVRTVHEVENVSEEGIVIEPIVGVLSGSNTESNSRNVSTFSIVGTDDRFLVSDTTARPYTAIAKLTITFPNGTVCVGTGYMVSQYTMATAGHCMYNSKYGGLATSVVAEFGKEGSSSFVKVDASHVVDIYYDAQYESTGSSIYDYAFVEFDVAVGFLVGSFGIDTNTPKGDVLVIAGYPADLNSGNYMYMGVGSALGVGNDLFEHNIDTYGGNSGSPVFILNGTSGYAKGIHITGINEYYPNNRARRLTTSLVNWLSNNGLL